MKNIHQIMDNPATRPAVKTFLQSMLSHYEYVFNF